MFGLFLQVKENVNKGIRNTLKMEPEMFWLTIMVFQLQQKVLPSKVQKDGSKFISKIRDMQIVNGGQTTASIYNITKEKDSNVDLAKVYVQMKITVIKAEEKMDEMVHKISEYANTKIKCKWQIFLLMIHLIEK